MVNLFEKYGEVVELPAYRYVYKENDESESFYFLKKGSIKLTKLSGDQENTVRYVKEGEVFGIVDFLTETKRLHTAKTADNTSLYKITKENYQKIIQEKEDFQIFYEKIILGIFKRIENNLILLASLESEVSEESLKMRIQRIIDERREMRLVLKNGQELLGVIRNIADGPDGPHILLMDSTGHKFFIPYHSLLYMVERSKK